MNDKLEVIAVDDDARSRRPATVRTFRRTGASLRQRRRGHLDAFGIDLVDGLVEMVRQRDPLTAAHLDAVAGLADRLAVHLGLDEAAAQRVTTAARLHDIGKQLIALGVLNKPSALDDGEWTLIRQHPERGAAILAGFPALAAYAGVVRAHHERIDGTGYPDGLAGSAIPYESKIIAVVDSYHAMTVTRPYSPACSHEAALLELRAGSGTQFDPEYVRAFDELMSRPARKHRSIG
jgi:HD-GYP domain-containing protein (c-di-GMP phosphodiesterase class II)